MPWEDGEIEAHADGEGRFESECDSEYGARRGRVNCYSFGEESHDLDFRGKEDVDILNFVEVRWRRIEQ